MNTITRSENISYKHVKPIINITPVHTYATFVRLFTTGWEQMLFYFLAKTNAVKNISCQMGI